MGSIAILGSLNIELPLRTVCADLENHCFGRKASVCSGGITSDVDRGVSPGNS
jgi:hypothetical protein